MGKVIKGLRVLLFALLLVLAAFGIGMTGAFLNNNRERYLDNEIKIENVDKKDDEDIEDELKK